MSQVEMSKEQAIRALKQFAFGALVTPNFQVSYVPFVLLDESTLEFHLAKTNPQLNCLSDERVLLTVLGPHTYVSSFDYQTQPQVPTWNYISINVIGRSQLLDKEETAQSIDRMIGYFEPKMENNPIAFPDSFKHRLLPHIVGVRVKIESIQGKAKLGLHKSEIDQAVVLKNQLQKGNHAYVTFVKEWMAENSIQN